MELRFKTGDALLDGVQTALCEPAHDASAGIQFTTTDEFELQEQDVQTVTAALAGHTGRYTKEQAVDLFRTALKGSKSAWVQTIKPEYEINHLVTYL